MIVAGILTPLENLLTWVLTHLHDTVGLTWAWSIVGLVVIVRMLLVPLTVRQIHSMQNLQAHAPEMKAIQQKYKHDKQKMNAEMMAFYKENQINPAASCLPMLAQFPVFIGLFFVLKDFEKEIINSASVPALPTRVAAPGQHHRGHEGGLGAAADRALRGQPADLVVPDVAEHAAGAARDAARPPDRVHPLRAQLPCRPDDLLADHEPVDDRSGPDHETADAEAATAAEEELANAAEGGGGSRSRGAGGHAGRREEAGARHRRGFARSSGRRAARAGERDRGRDDRRDRRRGEVGRAPRARTDAAGPRQGGGPLPGRQRGRARPARRRLRAGAGDRLRRRGLRLPPASRTRRPLPATARATTPPACASSSSGSRTRSASAARSRSRRPTTRSGSSATATSSGC